MIETRHQARIAKAKLAAFRQTLEGMPVTEDTLEAAVRNGMQSLVRDLEADLAEFDARGAEPE